MFRDHRWTLPVIRHAADRGLLGLPVTVVTLDRHEDSLEPDRGALGGVYGATCGFAELVDVVMHVLSPRDDDWIPAGMELGIIGDVVQFSTGRMETSVPDSVWRYTDFHGEDHRVYRLGMVRSALSHGGGLAASTGQFSSIRETIGFDAASRTFAPSATGLVLDIDLDFFTVEWDTVLFPFSEEVVRHEFDGLCQSPWYDSYTAAAFLRGLAEAAAVVTVASEPRYCGGVENTKRILRIADAEIFGGFIPLDKWRVDYDSVYPSEET